MSTFNHRFLCEIHFFRRQIIQTGDSLRTKFLVSLIKTLVAVHIVHAAFLAKHRVQGNFRLDHENWRIAHLAQLLHPVAGTLHNLISEIVAVGNGIQYKSTGIDLRKKVENLRFHKCRTGKTEVHHRPSAFARHNVCEHKSRTRRRCAVNYGRTVNNYGLGAFFTLIGKFCSVVHTHFNVLDLIIGRKIQAKLRSTLKTLGIAYVAIGKFHSIAAQMPLHMVPHPMQTALGIRTIEINPRMIEPSHVEIAPFLSQNVFHLYHFGIGGEPERQTRTE